MNTKYTKEVLEKAVKESICIADVLRKLGLRRAGGTHSHISRRLRFFEIDTSHFVGTTVARGRHRNPKKRSWQDILIKRDDAKRQQAVILRRALLESGRKYECEECGQPPIWNNKELRLHVDHKSRDWTDDRPENLRFLCLHCHSQTVGFSGSKGMTDLTNDNRGQRLRRQMKNGSVDENEIGRSFSLRTKSP